MSKQQIGAFASRILVVLTFIWVLGSFPTLGMLVPAHASGASLGQWQLRNPMPTGADLLGATYGSGMFVAVGDGGAIVTSPDGVNWTRCDSGSRITLHAVAYGTNTFVAVGFGDHDQIVTSPDGVTWTAHSLGYHTSLLSVAWGDHTFVAVGNGGHVITSPDGITWTERVSGTTQSLDLNGVAYGGGTFTAVGTHNGVGGTLTSPDGVNWTYHMVGQNLLPVSVTWGDNEFVAVGWDGTISTSADGSNWTKSSSGVTENLTGVAWGNHIFVAVAPVPPANGLGEIITSSNGRTWARQWKPGNGWPPTAVAYGGNIFVAVGEAGTILTSQDGTTWTSRGSGNGADLAGVAYGDHTFVAVGNYAIQASYDGMHWTSQTSPSYNLDGVAYGHNTFVAVGRIGTILTSPDGVTWTDHSLGSKLALMGVAWGNGMFVAVDGTGHIVTSPDGFTWTCRYSGSSNDLISGVVYGSKSFLAVGMHGGPGGGALILASPDGIIWTTHLFGNTALSSVAYGRNKYVAVGVGTIMTSTDGASWISDGANLTSKNLGSYIPLQGVTYGDSAFVAVGMRGVILTSPDGIDWTWRDSGVPDHLSSVTYGNGTFVAVGMSGTIVQAGTPQELAAPIVPAVKHTSLPWRVVVILGCVVIAAGLIVVVRRQVGRKRI